MRALVLLASVLVLLAGCTPSQQWHPVTTEESQQLAATRFHNYDAGTRPFHTKVDVQGSELTVDGWIDFVNHVGFARVTGSTFTAQTLLWGPAMIALKDADPGDQQPTVIPSPTDTDGWQIRDLDGTASSLDALLIFLSALGSDRPENPLLLQQAGALWLRSDSLEVAGEKIEVSVFAAPIKDGALGPDDPAPTPETATIRFWVADDGVMHRVEALLGNQWVTTDFGAATGQEMQVAQ